MSRRRSSAAGRRGTTVKCLSVSMNCRYPPERPAQRHSERIVRIGFRAASTQVSAPRSGRLDARPEPRDVGRETRFITRPHGQTPHPCGGVRDRQGSRAAPAAPAHRRHRRGRAHRRRAMAPHPARRHGRVGAAGRDARVGRDARATASRASSPKRRASTAARSCASSGVYSRPDRDPRFHGVTIVVECTIDPPVRAPQNPLEITEARLFLAVGAPGRRWPWACRTCSTPRPRRAAVLE